MYDNADADVRNLCVYRDFGCISNCLQSPGSSSIFCSDRSIWNYFVYIAQPTKMLFGYSEPGIFPEKITKKNEHDIPEKAILFQAILVSLLLAGVAVFPAVETIYNVLITMTALTSLFPYVLLFAAYIKIKRKKVDKPGLYQMTKNKKWGCFLGYMELVICVIAIVCSALPVMTTFKENVVYEVEMIGGGLLVIVSGLWLWKRSGLKNKTFEIE